MYYSGGEEVQVGDMVESWSFGCVGIVREIESDHVIITWCDDVIVWSKTTMPYNATNLILVRRNAEKLLTWV